MIGYSFQGTISYSNDALRSRNGVERNKVSGHWNSQATIGTENNAKFENLPTHENDSGDRLFAPMTPGEILDMRNAIGRILVGLHRRSLSAKRYELLLLRGSQESFPTVVASIQ